MTSLPPCSRIVKARSSSSSYRGSLRADGVSTSRTAWKSWSASRTPHQDSVRNGQRVYTGEYGRHRPRPASSVTWWAAISTSCSPSSARPPRTWCLKRAASRCSATATSPSNCIVARCSNRRPGGRGAHRGWPRHYGLEPPTEGQVLLNGPSHPFHVPREAVAAPRPPDGGPKRPRHFPRTSALVHNISICRVWTVSGQWEAEDWRRAGKMPRADRSWIFARTSEKQAHLPSLWRQSAEGQSSAAWLVCASKVDSGVSPHRAWTGRRRAPEKSTF